MDTLSLNTTPNPEGTFTTRWCWRQESAKQPSKGGTIAVTLSDRWQCDRQILAELSAIFHLLETLAVHGQNRLGSNLRIEVSFGAIKKALAKGAIKTKDRGDTDKEDVAMFAKFLATKYFEAQIKTARSNKWRDLEPKQRIETALDVSNVPTVYIESQAGPVVVSRHALNRLVGRKMYRDGLVLPDKEGEELLDVPDCKWSAAWVHLCRVLPTAIQGKVSEREHKRVLKVYQKTPLYLWHQDSGMVYVLVREKYGLEVATTMHDKYWIARNIPTQRGQQLAMLA